MKRQSTGLLSIVYIASAIAASVTTAPVLQCHAEEAGDRIDVEALFQQAMKNRDAGRYRSAITTFHDILSSDPMLHRARLELAVAYYKDLQYQEAIEEARKVLEDPATPTNVRVAISAFLA